MHTYTLLMSTPVANVCNCFAARKAARFITQIYERHLQKAGITGSQYTILTVVRSRPGISMLELAEELGMDRTSLVRALKPLYREAYIVDAPSETDSRKMLLTLSRAGITKFEESDPHWRAAQQEWNNKVGSERAKALREELISLTET
ncbi:transcriptional regulator, MarR family [Janthinobacterium sp. Marseille]|nr:transcriptional regulator, MarR family [Janthinobacterium sp. Marseille]